MAVCNYDLPAPNDTETIDIPEGVPQLRAFYLYLSNSCNLSCRHCWITPRFVNGQPDPGDVIDVELLHKAISEAKPLGLKSVKLTGGEPLLHPSFSEICDLATDEELMMIMETNGTLLTSDMARYLKNETSMEFISVSIDSVDAAKHDIYRGMEGSFKAAMAGLDHLVSAGYENAQVVMSVHRGNRNEIEDLVRLVASHGAASVKFNPVANIGRGALMQQQGETLDFAERMELDRYIFKELIPTLHTEGINIDLQLYSPPALTPISEIMRRRGDTSDCGVLGILGFLGSGDIALCGIGRNIPELVYGRLGEDSIRDIWFHHPAILKLRRVLADLDNYPDLCRDCTMARHCRTGCVAQNFQNGKHLVWPDGLCSEAFNQGVFPATRQKKMRESIHNNC